VSAQDIQYLQQAHQTNLAEIAAGRLAQQKGNSQTVRNLGGKFVTDYTNLDHALVPVAQSLNVSLPSTPNSAQLAVHNQLKAQSGTQFDNLFVTSQFAGNTQALRAGRTEIASGSNPKVVTLARDSQPVIESHHQALEAAARQLGIVLPTASAPMATPIPSGTVTLVPTASPTNTNS
jgi:predicted outer membrane protein